MVWKYMILLPKSQAPNRGCHDLFKSSNFGGSVALDSSGCLQRQCSLRPAVCKQLIVRTRLARVRRSGHQATGRLPRLQLRGDWGPIDRA